MHALLFYCMYDRYSKELINRIQSLASFSHSFHGSLH